MQDGPVASVEVIPEHSHETAIVTLGDELSLHTGSQIYTTVAKKSGSGADPGSAFGHPKNGAETDPEPPVARPENGSGSGAQTDPDPDPDPEPKRIPKNGSETDPKRIRRDLTLSWLLFSVFLMDFS